MSKINIFIIINLVFLLLLIISMSIEILFSEKKPDGCVVVLKTKKTLIFFMLISAIIFTIVECLLLYFIKSNVISIIIFIIFTLIEIFIYFSYLRFRFISYIFYDKDFIKKVLFKQEKYLIKDIKEVVYRNNQFCEIYFEDNVVKIPVYYDNNEDLYFYFLINKITTKKIDEKEKTIK